MNNADLDFSKHSDIAKMISSKDWNVDAIGTVDSLPPLLKAAFIIILNSKLPTLLFWGNNFVVFYNDTFLELLGSHEKHNSLLDSL